MSDRELFERAMDAIVPYWKALPEESHLIRICAEVWQASRAVQRDEFRGLASKLQRALEAESNAWAKVAALEDDRDALQVGVYEHNERK